MDLSCRFAIYPNFGIGHHSVEKQFNAVVFFTIGSKKTIAVYTCFITGFCSFDGIITSISVFSKSLQQEGTSIDFHFPEFCPLEQ